MSSPHDLQPEPAIQLLEAFRGFELSFSRWCHSLLESDSNSSPARMRLLGVLHCKGPQIMSGLGDALAVTARQVTNLVDALESEGLVQRSSHPTDRRATLIEITPKGAEQACTMWRPFQDKAARLFRELPESDQRELLRLLAMLQEALKRRGADSGASHCR